MAEPFYVMLWYSRRQQRKRCNEIRAEVFNLHQNEVGLRIELPQTVKFSSRGLKDFVAYLTAILNHNDWFIFTTGRPNQIKG